MEYAGLNTNGSQFYITFRDVPAWNRKHVVFGEVITGMNTLKIIEEIGSEDGTCKEIVKIENCGEVLEDTRETCSGDNFVEARQKTRPRRYTSSDSSKSDDPTSDLSSKDSKTDSSTPSNSSDRREGNISNTQRQSHGKRKRREKVKTTKEGNSKRIKRGRGFTEKYKSARRY